MFYFYWIVIYKSFTHCVSFCPVALWIFEQCSTTVIVLETLRPKTFTENWDSKAPSVGTLLALLETTAYIIFWGECNFFVFQDRKLKLSASVGKRISLNLIKFQLIQLIQTFFNFFYPMFDWVEILWGFMKLFFQQLKFSAFYLKKQKKVLFLKRYDL